jgi:hypothetical protein
MTQERAEVAADEAPTQWRWDVFISHAAEEKVEVAVPLAHKLVERGLRVWLDSLQIDLADNLRGKVNEGIAGSRFAVALLSARYLSKRWTIDELDAFMAREELGLRVVLPVLHGIEAPTLTVKYPLLANRIYGDTSKGLDKVADEVVGVVLKPGSGSPSAELPTLRQRLRDLLEKASDPVEVRKFLSHHPKIVVSAVGGNHMSEVRWTPIPGDMTPDLCVSTFGYSAGKHFWHVIMFDTLSSQLFESDTELIPSLRRSLDRLQSLREWIGANQKLGKQFLPNITTQFQGMILAGRRAHLTAQEKQRLETFNTQLFNIHIRVRTYDLLVEKALHLYSEWES